MARETSDRWTATRPRRYGTPRRGFRASPPRCSKISTKRRSISKPNYDDSEQEPEVLPTRVPNLLINGSSGIAVGMATNIPPHNLTEIIDATIRLVHEARTRNCPRSSKSCKVRIFRPAASSWDGKAFYEYFTKGRGIAQDARQGRHREVRQRPRSDHRHRDSLPGKQSAPD